MTQMAYPCCICLAYYSKQFNSKQTHHLKLPLARSSGRKPKKKKKRAFNTISQIYMSWERERERQPEWLRPQTPHCQQHKNNHPHHPASQSPLNLIIIQSSWVHYKSILSFKKRSMTISWLSSSERIITCCTTTSPGWTSTLCMQSNKTWHWESVSFLNRKWSCNARSICACNMNNMCQCVQLNKFPHVKWSKQLCIKEFRTFSANMLVLGNMTRFTSSSQVFLCDGDGGTQTRPFSREDSIALRRARDKSCLTRWFLEDQLTAEGDSDSVASITWGKGFMATSVVGRTESVCNKLKTS